MQFFEKAIAQLSPSWAAHRAEANFKRMEFRLRSKLLSDATRGYYDAAGAGRRTSSFNTSGSGPNAIWSSGEPNRLKYRTQDVVRTSPHAANGARKIANKIIGAGITPRFVTKNKAAKKMLPKRWDEFVRSVDPTGKTNFYGMQHLLARTTAQGGECFAVWKYSKTAPYLTATLLEGDFIDDQRTDWRASQDGSRDINGIRFNGSGRPVGYWMYNEHPGELYGVRASSESRLVGADFVDHVFDILRPGQVRGISWFAPVLLKIRDLADYDDAELVRKRVEACFGALVKTPVTSAASPLAGSTSKDAQSRIIEELSPGMIRRLQPGEEVSFAQPTSNDSYLAYLKVQLHAIAAGIGLTYEQLTGDLEGVNYSSIRAGMIDFWELLDHWQYNMVIHQFCVPTEQRFLKMLELIGEDIPRDLMIEWCPPARAYVDPLKDIASLKEEITGGLRTYNQIAASRGYDGDKLIQEIAAEKELRRLLGVNLDIDIENTKTAAPSGQGQSAADQPEN